MRLRYLAHASFLVEGGGVRLVTDPWLDGPTYLSAWWQFPEPAARGADLAGVDYVYLTHEHNDHFHPPTLAALPRSTPILIGRFMLPRFRDKLAALGFSDVRELPHGVEVPLGGGGLRVTSYQYRADDTALVLRDREATVLNLNDCLLRGPSLERVLAQSPRIDLLAMSFANAEAYPIVYDFDDPGERIDWDDRTRFDAFLAKVRRIEPRAFVPFASMFCFLAPGLRAINDRIVAPTELLARAARGEVAATGLAMNPGDGWTPERGHEVARPVDWTRKAEILDDMARRRAGDLAALAAREVVPGGRAALVAAFAEYFDGLARRLPPLALRRLALSVRLDVDGPEPVTLWLRFSGCKIDRTPPPSDDAWDLRLTLRDWPLWRVLTRQDDWQTLGISCRFRARLRPGVREREVQLWFLLYLDDLGYLSPLRLARPRALGVLLRRRLELLEYARGLLGGRFVDANLRQKFSD